MEYISVLQVALAFATLFVVSFFPVWNSLKRPKLNPYPEKKENPGPFTKTRQFGFTVENKGKNVAKNVRGVIEINSASPKQINWNNWYSKANYGPSHSERILQIDIPPRAVNKRWFFVEELETDRITSGKYEISIELSWEYLGQLEPPTKKKYSLNYTTWEESEIVLR